MTEKHADVWGGVVALINEIKTCEKAGAIASAIAMSYICIDTMSLLSLPEEKPSQTRSDFIGWVDTYLKAHPEQPYQYRGIDVYGARCAVVHAFGSEADLHAKYPDVLKFAYHNGGKHMHNPEIDKTLVLIGTASFLNDVVQAVQAFLDACNADLDLRARVESRLSQVLATVPIPSSHIETKERGLV